jgi:cytochrome c-type biogenesis protein
VADLLSWLSHTIEGAPALALIAAFIWGVLSILLSPCHLSSIPLIVGFIGGRGRVPLRRAFGLSLLFASGILVSIGAIGAVTAALGRMMGDLGAWGNYILAGILVLVGLYLLDVIPMPFGGAKGPAFRGKGAWGALFLGLFFGIALGPCTFAYMAPMLGITFRLAAGNIIYGIALLLAYGVGHCSVIVFAGTSMDAVQRYLNWNEKSKGPVVVKKVCGVLVIIAGLYLLWNA